MFSSLSLFKQRVYTLRFIAAAVSNQRQAAQTVVNK